MDWIKSCSRFAAAAGMPVCLFNDGEMATDVRSVYSDFTVSLFKTLPTESDGAFYTIIADYMFCGAVRLGERKAFIGPVASYKCSVKLAQHLLSVMGQSISRTNELLHFFREKPVCNLHRFLDALRFVGNLLGFDENNEVIFLTFTKPEKTFEKVPDALWGNSDRIKEVEDMVTLYVESGDTLGMSDFLNSPGGGHEPGVLAEDAVRSLKNTFIMSTSIITRAAVRGGLDYNTALWVQGSYLHAVEGMQSYREVLANLGRMFMDFTSRVADTRIFPNAGPVTTAVCRYINANIRDKISTSDIADALGYNRSYICRVFKAETGLTIADFTTQAKINAAKKLLAYTDKSLAEISLEMGFSSQNYFQSSFKKCTGETPGGYRGRERK